MVLAVQPYLTNNYDTGIVNPTVGESIGSVLMLAGVIANGASIPYFNQVPERIRGQPCPLPLTINQFILSGEKFGLLQRLPWR